METNKMYEAELAKAPECYRNILREECGGDPTTVYAVLNDCVYTRNEVLLGIIAELHGHSMNAELSPQWA
jgi:hypothetical protein